MPAAVVTTVACCVVVIRLTSAGYNTHSPAGLSESDSSSQRRGQTAPSHQCLTNASPTVPAPNATPAASHTSSRNNDKAAMTTRRHFSDDGGSSCSDNNNSDGDDSTDDNGDTTDDNGDTTGDDGDDTTDDSGDATMCSMNIEPVLIRSANPPTQALPACTPQTPHRPTSTRVNPYPYPHQPLPLAHG
ncbi:hypothetical protein EDB83DRAFT_2323105 [Lactarius deliciosus]|nr:hypothetical protein EDB83DRAFT_2323105 [Lactarius deliciosus]